MPSPPKQRSVSYSDGDYFTLSGFASDHNRQRSQLALDR
jgi:hypothetical protein